MIYERKDAPRLKRLVLLKNIFNLTYERQREREKQERFLTTQFRTIIHDIPWKRRIESVI